MNASQFGEIVERVEVGRHSLVLRRPADAEALIDERRFDEDEFLPYWAELWPSGIALARHLIGLELEGKSVLELGCGLALPSLAAALAGGEVLATDWAVEAVDLAAHNAAANGIVLAVGVLRWGTEPVPSLGAYDLVIAADVLYEQRNTEPLLALLDRAVARGGEALVADPGRRHAALFFDRARVVGWSCEQISVTEVPAGGIVRLRRRASRRSPTTVES